MITVVLNCNNILQYYYFYHIYDRINVEYDLKKQKNLTDPKLFNGYKYISRGLQKEKNWFPVL